MARFMPRTSILRDQNRRSMVIRDQQLSNETRRSVARLSFCLMGILGLGIAGTDLPATADTEIFQYLSLNGDINLTNVPSEKHFKRTRPATLYHHSISDTELEGAVGRAALEYRIQPALLLAVMKAESSFNPIVVSRSGAVGLMQLIPETAIRHGVRNLYDTEENITGGAKHLRYLLDRFHGSLRLALAAYNAGERVVDRYGKIPPYRETSLYVKKVMAYYRDYKKGGWVLPVSSDYPLTPKARNF